MNQEIFIPNSVIYQILPNTVVPNSTNCSVPKHFLTNATANSIQMPLYFKITNIHSNKYVICACDYYMDVDEDSNLIMLSNVMINELRCDGDESLLVNIEVINNSPDLIPQKAHTVFLKPESELFYKIENIKDDLENCFNILHIIGKGYKIPLYYQGQTVYIIIDRILDKDKKELQFFKYQTY